MSKRVYAGTLEDHSPEQAEVLRQLKEHLSKIGVNNKRYDDRYLLRFCRARKFEYPKVQLMFDNFLKWRRENGVEDIAKFDISPMYAAFDILPHNYYCIDREGRPVYMERYKNFDLKDLKDKVDENFVIKYYIYGYERLVNLTFPYLTKKSGKHIEQSVTILDLDGLNFTKIISKRNEIQSFLKLSSAIAQDNYPEIMGRLFIINAPFLFGVLWSIVKGFLDEKTQKKISVLSGSYKSELLKVISEEELPDWLGGKNKRTLKEGNLEELFAKAIKYKTWDVEAAEAEEKAEMELNQRRKERLHPNIMAEMKGEFVADRTNLEASTLSGPAYSEFSEEDGPLGPGQTLKLGQF